MAQQDAKYQEIIDYIKNGIAEGTFRYGDRLMSEKELAEKFHLSRQTVRHATGELVSQNVLTRVQGSGTYIGGAKAAVREKKYMRVAVISTFYESYIFPTTLKGIEKVLSKSGYVMELSFTDNRVSRERQILEQILANDNVDGIIVEPAKSALPNPNLDYYREIKKRGIPMIFFNAGYADVPAPCVRLDDREAGRTMTRLLIDAGHEKIAGIFKSDDAQGPLRYAGYLDSMREASLPTHQRSVLWIDTLLTSNLSDIEDYVFARLGDSTACICYNDLVAMQLIDMALRRGIRVPEDLSVVGIDDDSYLAAIGKVALTTYPHPKEALGTKAAENLLHIIDNPDYDGNYLFTAEPVRRASVRNLFQ